MTFVRIARAFGTALVCATAVAACSGGEDVSPVSGPTSGPEGEVTPANEEIIGRYKVTVDPTAAEPIVFEPVEDSPSHFGTKDTPTMPDTRSVMTSISLSGPGTWNAATQTLSATVVMTHTGAIASSFNEPQMVVTALSDTTGTVTFETTNNGQKGVGATMAFPDIERPGSTPACGTTVGVRSSAQRYFAIKDTNPATSFSFTVDVRATTSGVVSPDCDNDGFNSENQDAGNDCNDANANQTSACTCSDGCTLAGATCQQPVTSGAFTCSTACSCDVNGANGSDVAVTCQQNCDVDCAGARDTGDPGLLACRNVCGTGKVCNLDCSNIAAGNCETSCSGAANCTLNCSGANAGTCQNNGCTGNNTTCSTICTGSGTSCGVATCGNNTTCNVTCGSASSTSNYTTTCGINTCNRASCTVACVNPGPLGCAMTCTTNSVKCEMDCSAIPAANRNALCKLTCPAGKTKTQLANGTFVCQ